MRNTLIISSLVFGLGALGATAYASGSDTRIDAPRSEWMSVEQISAKFAADGYDVRQVKEEDGGYEIYALDAGGKRIEAYVHPVTGAILEMENDDESDDDKDSDKDD